MSLNHKSQSALEYMMTYGWAILVIVIVAGVLYSLGIFSPASSLSSTVTGFSNLGSVTGECTANGVLRISLGDSTGYPINITSVTAKSSTGQISTFQPNSTADSNSIIQPTSTYIFSVPNICPAAGSRYSLAVTVNYTEPGQIFPGPYASTGTITGAVSSSNLPDVAAFFNGNAYPAISCSGGICGTSGADTYINATNPLPGVNKSYTLVLWALDTGVFNENYNSSFVEGSNGGSNGNDSNGLFAFSVGATGSYQDLGVGPNVNKGRDGPGLHRCEPSDVFPDVQTNFFNGQWHFVAVSVDIPSYTFELDSNQYTASNSNAFSSGSLMAIGPYTYNRCDEGPFNGYISNVQLYNGSLSSAQLLNLYQEGILGAPLSIAGAPLIGWWPLNGTISGLAKDYAGSDNGNFINSYITSNYP